MTGVLQGVVVSLLFLVSTCITQELSGDIQKTFSLRQESQRNLEDGALSQRQPLHSRLNFSRRFQRFRANAPLSRNDERLSENSQNSDQDQQDFKPSSQQGFIRRVDRFRAQDQSFEQQTGDSEDSRLRQGSITENLQFSNTQELRNTNDPPNTIIQDQEIQYGRSNDQTSFQEKPEFQSGKDSSNRGLPNALLASERFSDDQLSYQGSSQPLVEGDIERNQVTGALDETSSIQLSNQELLVGNNDSRENVQEVEGPPLSEGDISSIRNAYPRVRLQPGANRGRRRFIGLNRRRLLRLRRPGLRRRRLQNESLRNNPNFQNQESTVVDNGEFNEGEREIDSSSHSSPSKEAQQTILQENSETLGDTQLKNIADRENPNILSGQVPTQSTRDQKSIEFENAEAIANQPFVANNPQYGNREEILQTNNNDNRTPQLNNSFRRLPSNVPLRTRFNRLNNVKNINSFEQKISRNNIRFSNNKDEQEFSPGQENLSGRLSGRRVPQKPEPRKILPVQFTRNQQSYSRFEQNSNANPDNSVSKQYLDIQQLRNDNSNAFGENEQSFRPQVKTNERLNQFQQQIENKRLLQYPQQNDGIDNLNRAHTRVQQLQQVLGDQRLLQYPQQRENQHLFSSQFDNRQNPSSLEGDNDKFVQNFEQRFEENEPSQQNYQQSQRLTDQHFKPAQFSDVFGAARAKINEDEHTQTKGQIINNQSVGTSQPNIDTQFSSQSDGNVQSSTSQTGKIFSTENTEGFPKNQPSVSTESVRQISSAFNQNIGHQSQGINNLPSHSQRQFEGDQRFFNTQRRDFNERRPQYSQTSTSDFAPLSSQQGIERVNINQQTDLPSRLSSSPRFTGSLNSDRDRQESRRFRENNYRPQQTDFSQKFSSGERAQHATSSDNRFEQDINSQSGDYQISNRDNQFKEGLIQKDNVLNSQYETRFAQDNTYLPHQYRKFGQNRLLQNQQTPRHRLRTSNNSNRRQENINNQNQQLEEHQNYFSNDEITTARFSSNSGENFRGNQPSSINQNQPQVFSQGLVNHPSQHYTQGKEYTEFRGISSTSEENENQKFSQQQPLTAVNQQTSKVSDEQGIITEDQRSDINQNFSNTYQGTPGRLSDSHSQTSRPRHQEDFTITETTGKISTESRNAFQKSDDNIPENIEATQHIQNDQVQLRERVQDDAKRSRLQTELRSGQDSSRGSAEFSHNQNYFSESEGPHQKGDQVQSNFPIEQPKVTNSHGQPGFTYQRNLDSSDRVAEGVQREDHSVTGNRQDIISSPDDNKNYQSKDENDFQSSPDEFINERPENYKDNKFNHQEIARSENPRQSQNQRQRESRNYGRFSGGSVSNRGNRKFLDTIENVNTQETEKELLQRIAAVLQGKEYYGGGPSRGTQRSSGAPRLTEIPDTGFRCQGRVSGYYADSHENAKCQSFHFCGVDGSKISYLCPTGTVFNQRLLVCDHVFRVRCNTSEDFYYVNERIYGADVHEPLRDDSREGRGFGRRI